MQVNMDVVPATIEEAITMLRDGLTDGDREQMKNTKVPTELHYSVGLWVRTKWELWDPSSRLMKDFFKIGLHHPDDASWYLVKAIWHHYRGEPFDSERFVEVHQQFWKDQVGNPIP